MPRLPKQLALAALLLCLPVSAPSARTATAQTGEPSREPVLRIETGMHTAGIKRGRIGHNTSPDRQSAKYGF